MRDRWAVGWQHFVGAALAISPFFQGLFQTHHQLPAVILMALVLAVFLWRRPLRERNTLNLLDYSVLGLAALYWLGVVWGVNHRSALQEALKQVMYIGVYWMVSRSIKDLTDLERYLRATGLVGFLITVGSVLIAGQWIPYHEAVYDHRLAGPFQYPNAMAGVLLVGITGALAARSAAGRPLERMWWGAATAIQAIFFVFTYSRFAWAVAPVVGLIQLLLMPKGTWGKLLASLISTLVALGAVALPIDRTLKGETFGMLPVWFVTALVVVVAVEGILEVGQQRGWFRKHVVYGLIAVAVVALVVVVVPRASFLTERITALRSGNDPSLPMRIWTYRDAVRAWVTESPVLGLGGGGWRSLFLKYRTFDFTSKVVHSSVLETLTEVGIQGVLLLLGAWALGLWQGVRAILVEKSRTSLRILLAGLVAGMAGLMLHSVVDFDLWYPAIAGLLYAGLGGLRALTPTTSRLPAEQSSSAASRWIPASLLVLLAVAIVPLTIGYQSARTGVALFQRQAGVEEVEAAFARAAMFDPINSLTQLQYGDLLVQLGVNLNDPARLASGGARLERALELDRFNPDVRILLANYYIAIGEKDRAMDLLEEAVTYNPVSLQVYQRAVARGLDEIIMSLRAKDTVRIQAYLKRIEVLFTKFEDMRASQPHEAALLKFTQDDELMPAYRAQHLLFVGDWDEAARQLKSLERVTDPAIKGDVLMWTAALAAQRGDTTTAQQYVNTLLPLDAKKAEQVGTLANLLGEAKGIR